MPRRIQATYTKGIRSYLAAMGSSSTLNLTLGVLPSEFWPERLAALLREDGVGIAARNFGRSGDTSANMLARMGRMTEQGAPEMGAIIAGLNDPGNSIAGEVTQANIVTMGAALLDAGTAYVVIGNAHYLNWTSGGDGLDSPYAMYATLRTYQQAAADELAATYPGRVAYADVYGYMRQLIVDGIVEARSASWHVAPTDQHLNGFGGQVVADAFYATLAAQDGWLDALRAI